MLLALIHDGTSIQTLTPQGQEATSEKQVEYCCLGFAPHTLFTMQFLFSRSEIPLRSVWLTGWQQSPCGVGNVLTKLFCCQTMSHSVHSVVA